MWTGWAAVHRWTSQAAVSMARSALVSGPSNSGFAIPAEISIELGDIVALWWVHTSWFTGKKSLKALFLNNATSSETTRASTHKFRSSKGQAKDKKQNIWRRIRYRECRLRKRFFVDSYGEEKHVVVTRRGKPACGTRHCSSQFCGYHRHAGHSRIYFFVLFFLLLLLRLLGCRKTFQGLPKKRKIRWKQPWSASLSHSCTMQRYGLSQEI